MIPGKLNLKLVEYLIFYYTERPHKDKERGLL